MSILFDSSVVIDVARGKPEALAYVSSLPSVPTCSEVTRVEVLRGMRSVERSSTLRLLAGLQWAPVDRLVAERAGELGRTYRASHRGLDVSDLIIAATAQLQGLPLATSNVRHFPMFEGLQPPY